MSPKELWCCYRPDVPSRTTDSAAPRPHRHTFHFPRSDPMNKTTTKATPGRKRPWLKWVVGGGLLVVVLAAAGIWWFLRDDAPPPVSLDAAVNAVQTSAATSDTAVTP